VPESNDDETLERAISGDREAFGLLYEQYVGRIYNYIYYRTGNVYDAEDLTERVFMRALRHIGRYNQRGLPFSAWLYRIAHNLVANWHRDNSRRKEIPLDDGILSTHPGGFPETEMMRVEEQEGLLRVIRCLPSERQQLLILKFVDHLSNAEIGLVMGRTEGAIKSLYHRTLLAIRDELGQVPSEMQADLDEAERNDENKGA
jgi:RNA polymerase sigma-70 factor (ECF subfamily)